MTVFFAAAAAAVICAAVVGLVFAIRPLRFTPRDMPEDVRVTHVVSADGGAGGLELTVRELLRRGDDGGQYRSVLITDCGLSGEGRRIAELLAAGDGRVALISPEELPAALLEDGGWTTTDSTYK